MGNLARTYLRSSILRIGSYGRRQAFLAKREARRISPAASPFTARKECFYRTSTTARISTAAPPGISLVPMASLVASPASP